MKKDAIIKIVSIRTTENGDDNYEMTVVGSITHDGEKSIIEYEEENEETDKQETKITIIDNSTVNIMRAGQFSSEMSIENNKRHLTFYNTPYGSMTIGVYGNNVHWFRNGKNCVLKMKYTLDFNNDLVSENSMNIYIEEK